MTGQIKMKGKTQKLDRYEGKWVAFRGKEIVASGNTLEDLEMKVQRLPPKEKFVYFLVPRKDEGPYILYLRYEKRV